MSDAEVSGGRQELRKLRCVSAEELLTLELPPRENLLEPWLPRQGLAMVFAKRGVGKTHVGLGIAHAVASGGRFLKWQASKPQRVLYLDGEMPAYAIKERVAQIERAQDSAKLQPDYLRIITPDLQPYNIPNLAEYEGQRAVADHLREVKLIVIDNLSTLCRGGRENEAESWLVIQDWCLKLRRVGWSVLFIHHAGKNGEQRGTSRREDVLDTVIELRHPHDYHQSDGARFEVRFTKARGLSGESLRPFEARLDTSDGAARWTVRDVDDSLGLRMDALFEEGFTVREIAQLVGLSKSAVHRHKQAGEGSKLLAAPGPGVPGPGTSAAGQGGAEAAAAQSRRPRARH